MKYRHTLRVLSALFVLASLSLSCRRGEAPEARAASDSSSASIPMAPVMDDTVLDAVPASRQRTPAVTEAMASGRPAGTLGLSLENEVQAAIQRSLDWLANLQREDGSWSNPKFPALTALVTHAFIHSQHPRKDAIIARGVNYIIACAKDDGGIYHHIEGRRGGGLSNYNTAICMTTLHATGNPKLTPYVLNARRFIAGAQHFGDDRYEGGFGYDQKTDRAYTDLLNTYYAVIAMRETADAEEARPAGEARVDIDWSKTVKYVESLQNTAEAGSDQEGGFIYKPGESKAGSVTNETGSVYFRSYGSMTYAGMLALIYAEVDREDVRVRSAFDWASRHWTLEENPGMGAEGLFYFYNVLTKSLDAMKADAIPAANAKGWINWREEIAKKLVATQTIDPKTGQGFWTNENGRFWERDPVLVTAYSLLALLTL